MLLYIHIHLFLNLFARSKYFTELGNGIYVSISKYGSDTPVTRPETDKAGLSSRDRNIFHKVREFFNTSGTQELNKL